MNILKKLIYPFLFPLVVVLSYFFTSYIVSMFTSEGNNKLFANTVPWIVVGIFLNILVFSGVVYALYLFTRDDRKLRITAVFSIVVSLMYHVFTSLV